MRYALKMIRTAQKELYDPQVRARMVEDTILHLQDALKLMS